jgi:uncharacterized Zn finger protein (UPF0148 family)
MKNPYRIELYEQVKLSWLRHLGDYDEIQKDFPELDRMYIERLIWKIKRAEDIDINVKIVNNLTREIYVGYYARVRHCVDMVNDLNKKEFSYLSMCCKKPVRTDGGKTYCMKCGYEAETELSDRLATFESKRTLIVEWRNEVAALVDFATKMKYTPAEIQQNTGSTYNVKQYNVTLENQKKVLETIHEQSPADRERVIQSIETQLKEISYKVAEMDSKEGSPNGQPK